MLRLALVVVVASVLTTLARLGTVPFVLVMASLAAWAVWSSGFRTPRKIKTT